MPGEKHRPQPTITGKLGLLCNQVSSLTHYRCACKQRFLLIPNLGVGFGREPSIRTDTPDMGLPTEAFTGESTITSKERYQSVFKLITYAAREIVLIQITWMQSLFLKTINVDFVKIRPIANEVMRSMKKILYGILENANAKPAGRFEQVQTIMPCVQVAGIIKGSEG
jgi:hypothetical protein